MCCHGLGRLLAQLAGCRQLRYSEIKKHVRFQLFLFAVLRESCSGHLNYPVFAGGNQLPALVHTEAHSCLDFACTLDQSQATAGALAQESAPVHARLHMALRPGALAK